MKNFTGFDWLLIDAANQFGYDKLTFEKRIEWATENLPILESFADTAETKPLYIKAVMAIRKAQAGIPTGHMVGVDSVCSGIQIMSVLAGCVAGATATGCVDPDVRADAYTSVTKAMESVLGGTINISRDDAKRAVMTSFYGSKLVPKILFGEDTSELGAFYKAANMVAPGAWELLQDLLASWQPYALSHSWKMPDGFDVNIKVMEKKQVRIEIDELNHATFTYKFYENEGSKTGLSNVANMTHSVDAYILRAMHRRCNYDSDMVKEASRLIEIELIRRNLNFPIPAQ
jgi:DNA-dependent RNA polymerase